jgi:hypothetical protein
MDHRSNNHRRIDEYQGRCCGIQSKYMTSGGSYRSSEGKQMRLFKKEFVLSESTRRNLSMAPGVALIAGVMLADACSGNARHNLTANDGRGPEIEKRQLVQRETRLGLE